MGDTKEPTTSEEAVAPKRRRKLGEILVEAGLLSQEQLAKALDESAKAGTRLGVYLVERAIVSEDDIAQRLAYQLGFLYVDLAKEALTTTLSSAYPEALATRYRAVPIRLDGKSLTVAMADPRDFDAIRDLSFFSGCTVKPMLAGPTAIKDAVATVYFKQAAATAIDRIASDSTEEFSEDLLEVLAAETLPSAAEIQSLEEATRQAPVVRLGNMIMTQAVRAKASDIHIEPTPHNTLVRYRIDGLLREIMRLPKVVHASLVSRLKILAKMDIAERRIPQDGVIRVKIETREVDFRVSTLLTLYGEKMVLRVNQARSRPSLESLGLSEKAHAAITAFTHRHKGIILVTGPTGSGKTTTLYAILNAIMSPSTNLITVEDPVEATLLGINQTQINPDAGLTFAGALRAILRQDPDIILVGEIRDLETAEIAARAAMTGHLVLSTLHTNSAAGALPRLLDMKVEPFLIASTTNLITAQRLVRTLCEEKEEYTLSSAEIQAIGREIDLKRMLEILKKEKAVAPSATFEKIKWARPKKTQDCPDGYKGRIGIHEALEVTPTIQELIMRNATADEIEAQARKEGMLTMLEDGFMKAAQKITSIEEVLRVTSE